MANTKPTSYRADYYYEKRPNGSRTRRQTSGYVHQHLEGATTESAVLKYLRKKHPGHEITLMSVEWM